MSLTVISFTEHVNHSDSRKVFGYREDSYDSEEMLEILSGLFDEFMIDLCIFFSDAGAFSVMIAVSD